MTTADRTVGEILQQVDPELYRDNVEGAHALLEPNDHAGHASVSTGCRLHERFGAPLDFRLSKIPGELPRRFPATLAPLELGTFFVALSSPR